MTINLDFLNHDAHSLSLSLALFFIVISSQSHEAHLFYSLENKEAALLNEYGILTTWDK